MGFDIVAPVPNRGMMMLIAKYNGLRFACGHALVSASLALFAGTGCGGSSPEESLGSVEQPILNVNNEFLQYGTRANWTGVAFAGDRGTFLADVTGDAKADAIAVNSTGVFVRRSNGSSFNANEAWTTVGFWGSRGTFFADVTGDRKADAIVVNDAGVTVRRSNGSSFGANETWTANGFWGSRGTFFADVTGDGWADAIAVNDGGVTVRRSNGSSFTGNETWTTNGFWGDRGTFFADVSGDGLADAIAVNNNAIFVRLANGQLFGGNQTWTPDAFFGGVGTFFADVTADGKADAVVVNSDGVWMRRSNGFNFGSNELLADQTSLGAVLVGEVNGDARADLVEIATDGLRTTGSRERVIKVRFVQFTADGNAVVTNTQLDNVLAVANLVYRPAGLKFVRQASHVVTSGPLSFLDNTGAGASATELAKAKPFNPGCDIGSVAGVTETEQINLVSTRCALDGEVMVYVAGSAASGGFSPWHGKTVIMTTNNITDSNTTNMLLAHELGHYLGLPHVWESGGMNPQTNTLEGASLFWDLQYQPGGTGFANRAAAAAVESQLQPIQRASDVGWWCPSGDPAKFCVASWPLGTFVMPVRGADGQDVLWASGAGILKGLAPRLPNHDFTFNVMSYNYSPNPSNVQQRTPGLSLSQIEQIRRVLTFDVFTDVTSATGASINAKRSLLGR